MFKFMTRHTYVTNIFGKIEIVAKKKLINQMKKDRSAMTVNTLRYVT